MAIDLAEAQQLTEQWRPRLGLADWWVSVSSLAPGEDDSRSEVDIDRNLHRAVLRFDGDLPEDQLERQVVHELLHIRLAELEDCFRQVEGDDHTARKWWDRSQERTVEALASALVQTPRREYRGDRVWWQGLQP